MPKILIERFKNLKLNYIKESGIREDGKHYIGRIEGPSADLLEPTRNGRKYGLKLWRNVENSDDFKEGMETHTIFGEADHPEDRLETKIKEIAVCLRKFEIRENEGIVWCSFDILDTPNGRIVKELLDYGSQLGVSSRGSGEEIIDENGENIIDPDTYLFICFDVVIMPAVKKARPTQVEAMNRIKLSESIKSEINSASTQQELNSIKSIIESANLPDNDSLLESINNKLDKLNLGDNISDKLMKDLEESINKYKELELENKNIKSKLSANNIRINEMNNLIKSMKINSKSLIESLNTYRKSLSKSEDNIIECSEQYSECLNENAKLKKINLDLNRKLNRLSERLTYMNSKNTKLNEELDSIKTNVTEFNNIISESNQRNNDYISENRKLLQKVSSYKSDVNTLNNRLNVYEKDIKQYKKSNSELIKENKTLLNNYVKLKATQYNLSENLVYDKLPSKFSIEDVNKIVENLRTKHDRISKVPIMLSENNSILNISNNQSNDVEMEQLTSLLSSMKK